MSRRSLKKKYIRRHSKGRRSLMSSNYGPVLLLVGIIIASIAALVLLTYFAVFPILKMFGIKVPEKSTPTPSPIVATPAPTPHPLEAANLASLQKEVVINSAKYINDPFRHGNKILYSSGLNESGSPFMHTLFSYDIDTRNAEPLNGIKSINDDIFFAQMNDDWIVWLDQKRAGGGAIMASKVSGGSPFTVKAYYTGKPAITLDGNTLVWTERTGSTMDKVFLYDLTTGENITVAMLQNTSFGMSESHIYDGKLIWAEPADSNPEQGKICTLDLKTGLSTSYEPEMYVHDPKTNGEATIWINSNHSEDAALYIRVGNSDPKLIKSGVTSYCIGDGFVAYCFKESVYIYLYKGTTIIDKKITLEGERCLLIGESSNTVFWYDLGLGARDILKYAPIN